MSKLRLRGRDAMARRGRQSSSRERMSAFFGSVSRCWQSGFLRRSVHRRRAVRWCSVCDSSAKKPSHCSAPGSPEQCAPRPHAVHPRPPHCSELLALGKSI